MWVNNFGPGDLREQKASEWLKSRPTSQNNLSFIDYLFLIYLIF